MKTKLLLGNEASASSLSPEPHSRGADSSKEGQLRGQGGGSEEITAHFQPIAAGATETDVLSSTQPISLCGPAADIKDKGKKKKTSMPMSKKGQTHIP